MSRVVFYHKQFKVLQVGQDSFVVVRKNSRTYEHHSHLSSLTGAIRLIKLLDQGILPHSPYLQESAKRLLRHQEFMRLKTTDA